MNRDDIIRMTWEAGGFDATPEFFERYTAIVVASVKAPRREWVSLTEVDPSVEQLDQIIDLLARTHVRISARELLRVWIVAYTRAIEAKLKEKNQ